MERVFNGTGQYGAPCGFDRFPAVAMETGGGGERWEGKSIENHVGHNHMLRDLSTSIKRRGVVPGCCSIVSSPPHPNVLSPMLSIRELARLCFEGTICRERNHDHDHDVDGAAVIRDDDNTDPRRRDPNMAAIRAETEPVSHNIVLARCNTSRWKLMAGKLPITPPTVTRIWPPLEPKLNQSRTI
jgi:hypothetical protein